MFSDTSAYSIDSNIHYVLFYSNPGQFTLDSKSSRSVQKKVDTFWS